MVGILLNLGAEREPSTDLQPVCSLSQTVLSEMTARVRMSCAGPVRIVDGRESAEADGRSDQLQMLDRDGVDKCFGGSASIDADARCVHSLRIRQSRAGGFKFRHSVNIRAVPNSPAVRL